MLDETVAIRIVPAAVARDTILRRQAMDNIGAVLARRGLSFDAVVKCTAMLADMNDWPAFNKVYVGYFKPGQLPARSAFAASGLALGGRIELECWAYNPIRKHHR